MKRLSSIQAVRGFAALLGVLFHATFQCHKKFGFYFLDNLFQFGYAGVDLFFVLSGFLIYYVHQSDVGGMDYQHYRDASRYRERGSFQDSFGF